MPHDLPGVLERVIATVQATLRRTHDEAGPGAELRLIQSKEDIERWGRVRVRVRLDGSSGRVAAAASLRPPHTPIPHSACRPRILHRAARLHRPTDIKGVLFDMDGTLTEPGQIDFARIRRRLAIPDGHDILTHIEALPSAAEREAALAVVVEEEVAGFHDVRLQEGAERVVDWLRRTRRLRVGLATRNNDRCVGMLLEQRFEGNPATFHPVLTRVFKSDVDVHKVGGRLALKA